MGENTERSQRVLEARKRVNAKAGKSAATRAIIWAAVSFLFFTLILSTAAIIESVIAMRKLKFAGTREGMTAAIIGLVLGILALGLGILSTFINLGGVPE